MILYCANSFFIYDLDHFLILNGAQLILIKFVNILFLTNSALDLVGTEYKIKIKINDCVVNEMSKFNVV